MVEPIFGDSIDRELDRVRDVVDYALDDLCERDRHLLDPTVDINERSITHRLGMHLQRYFGDRWDVDCEYNRNLNSNNASENVKRLPPDIPRQKVDWRDTNGITIYPDIIVHRRGVNTHNLLVVEVKKQNGQPSEWDLEKLRRLQATRADVERIESQVDPYDMWYRYTLFIRFEQREGLPWPQKIWNDWQSNNWQNK